MPGKKILAKRGPIRPRRLAAAFVLLPSLAITVLAIVDFVSIGRTPSPCASQASTGTIALVLSGGADYRRTRHAITLYHRGKIARIAFSGAGAGANSARNLARRARQLGVPKANILIEDQARSTAQNFEYACRLPGLKKARRIAIVTDRFHDWRAWETARVQCPKLHFCSAAVAGPVSMRRRLRETGKLVVYQLLGRADLW